MENGLQQQDWESIWVISKMAALRRARKALRNGWIMNQEQRKHYPADYTIGEPMPRIEGLPTLEDLTEELATLVTVSPLPDSVAEIENSNAVTRATDGNTQPHINEDVSSYPSHPCPQCNSEWTFSPEGLYVCDNCGFLHPTNCNPCQEGDTA
jgi:hypothetical protein